MRTPDVSIVTAAYNAAETIERALESVRSQTIDDERIEHIVVDDGSTDDTAAVVSAFDASYIEFLRNEENRGAVETLNRGIEAARGDYVVMLDADDEFLPSLVERMATVLDTDPDVDFVYADYYEEFPDGDRITVDTGADILNTIKIGIMHRRDHLHAFDLYDPDLFFPEYDLLLEYLDAGLAGHHISEPLFVYHRRRDSLTGDQDRVRAGVAELRDKHGQDLQIRGYDF